MEKDCDILPRMHDVNNYEILNLRNAETRISHSTIRYNCMEMHSRFFSGMSAAEKFRSISHSIFCWSFYSRSPFIRKSKVLKQGIIFTVFPRRELSTTRRFLLLCSCISWASLKLCHITYYIYLIIFIYWWVSQ